MLDEFFKPEKFDGAIYHCDKCSRQRGGALVYREAKKQMCVSKLPGVLRFHLKRFRWLGARREKIQTHVEFEPSLDLREYCTPTAAAQAFRDSGVTIPDSRDNFMYDLVGVIVHEGRGINSGHYVSLCYNPVISSWILCNDARVSVSTEANVLQSQAYVLFYAHREATAQINRLPQAPTTPMTTPPSTPPAKRWCP